MSKKIYIGSSWRNKHGVQLLTARLIKMGYTVISWIENCNLEGSDNFVFEDWIKTQDAIDSFYFDTEGATGCDIFIYYGPAGKDACCEMGAAYSRGITIYGLYAKGEDLGLMRMMANKWFEDYEVMLSAIEDKFTDELPF